MDSNLLDMLNAAVQSSDWVSVVAVGALIVLSLVVIVLKALKKPVPVLDSVLEVGKGLVKVLPKKEPPAPVDSSKTGLAAVVKIDDKREVPPNQ